jgi:hypothetical protein
MASELPPACEGPSVPEDAVRDGRAGVLIA